MNASVCCVCAHLPYIAQVLGNTQKQTHTHTHTHWHKLKPLSLHSSIFKLAREVTGLHLKPVKCVLVISCIELTEDLKFAIGSWLTENVPEFSEFEIRSSGKHLVW